jgi:hypothetical protein
VVLLLRSLRLINPPDFYDQTQQLFLTLTVFLVCQKFSVVEQPKFAVQPQNLLWCKMLVTLELQTSWLWLSKPSAEGGRRMVALARQFMTGEQVARVIGKDGEPIWIQYDRDYLEGDFDFEVVAGSTQPHNESFPPTNGVADG